MIISIASGKGGTGKTTVAVNLAASIGDRAQLMDCDVEAPNAHLFFNPEIKISEKVFVAVPQIDIDKCTFCKKCSEICRFRAIAVFGQTLLTFPELCHSCGGCLAVCPEGAVSETGRQIGTVETGMAGMVSFVHGCLRVGEAMSPPLIKKVKSKVGRSEIIIIDAPPGTSCPVITAMKHTDFVLMVTEPTPFGLHDLKLAVEAVKSLGIPHGLVINRADQGNGQVQEFAVQENIPVLMTIPFDRNIAELYSKGHLLVDEMPQWRKSFRLLCQRIETLVNEGDLNQ